MPIGEMLEVKDDVSALEGEARSLHASVPLLHLRV